MITALAIYPNATEFSRFEADRKVATVRVIPTPTTAPAELVTVNLLRGNGDILASAEIDFTTGDYPKGQVVSFDLSSLVDGNGFPLVTTGDYSIQAKTGTVGKAIPITVALMTVNRLKKSYCAGLPLKQRDVLTAVKQPALISGVTIIEVSPESCPGIGLLTFKIDGEDKTLQWNGGAVVEIPDTPCEEILPDDLGNYITVQIDPFDLPTANSAEGIVIDCAPIDDETLRGEIRNAVAEMERAVGSFLEPKRVATAPYFDEPEQGEFFDIKAQTAHFYRQESFCVSSLAWRTNLPYVNVQRVDLLEGFFGGTKVLELQSGYYALNRKAGTVEVLPQSAQLSYIMTFYTRLNFWGVRETISEFWRYKAIVGIPETEGSKDDLLKAVGYIAAIPILAIAGQSARGGRVSESTSKDGVSRSTSSGGDGLYGATITQYQKWLDANRTKLRRKYCNMAMATL